MAFPVVFRTFLTILGDQYFVQSVSEVVEKAVQAVPSEVLDAPPGLDYGGCPSLERPTGLPEFNVFQSRKKMMLA